MLSILKFNNAQIKLQNYDDPTKITFFVSVEIYKE